MPTSTRCMALVVATTMERDGVNATPTILLVNKNGTVLEAWEGAGPPEKQSSILRAIDVALR